MDEYTDSGQEILRHGTKGFPIAYYSGDVCEAPVSLHWHDEFEAGFVTEGTLCLAVGKERIIIGSGEGYLFNTGILHGLKGADGIPVARQCSLVFSPALIGGRFDSVFWQNYVQPMLSATTTPFLHLHSDVPWEADCLALLRQAWEFCSRRPTDYELETRYALTRFFSLAVRHLPPAKPTETRRAARDHERIRVMLSYIQDRFSDNLTADEIACSAMISTSECLRCFHNTIGLTPVQYLKYYRIQQSAQLLQSTNDKISDIAQSCGFQEMSYFAKTFREFMHVTPYEYRKRFLDS